jgi:hypothetical protein
MNECAEEDKERKSFLQPSVNWVHCLEDGVQRSKEQERSGDQVAQLRVFRLQPFPLRAGAILLFNISLFGLMLRHHHHHSTPTKMQAFSQHLSLPKRHLRDPNAVSIAPGSKKVTWESFRRGLV